MATSISDSGTGRRRALSIYHLASATVLGTFIGVHIANHVLGFWGQAQHVAFMQALRPLYRNAVVEPIMLALFTIQIVSGTVLVVRGWRDRQGGVAWLQAGSGIYLAVFIVFHSIAVLSGRFAFGLDTDFRFAAAGFHVPAWPWFFWPYYTLAVFALFTHIGCAIYWSTVDRNISVARYTLGTMLVIGAVLGLLIASTLAGQLYAVDIPARYKAIFSESFLTATHQFPFGHLRHFPPTTPGRSGSRLARLELWQRSVDRLISPKADIQRRR